MSEQGLQGVDWGLLPPNVKHVVQNTSNGAIYTVSVDYKPVSGVKILATRPKPKAKPLTDEQVEAVFMFVDEVKDSGQLSGADTLWLNEFACEIKEREQ